MKKSWTDYTLIIIDYLPGLESGGKFQLVGISPLLPSYFLYDKSQHITNFVRFSENQEISHQSYL